jgi:hypothetical protein
MTRRDNGSKVSKRTPIFRRLLDLPLSISELDIYWKTNASCVSKYGVSREYVVLVRTRRKLRKLICTPYLISGMTFIPEHEPAIVSI